jgi:RNA polymerase sigma factor (TIGR02999 family)
VGTRGHDNPPAEGAAWEALYGELHALAERRLRAESMPDLLQPTALVHEAWLRLSGAERHVVDRAHFLRLAARAMRQVLIDQARALRGPMRDPGGLRVTLDSRLPEAADGRAIELLDIDAALARLAAEDPRCAEVLEMHYFGGFGYAEMAEVLEVSEATVKRDLRAGRAWLLVELDTQ